MGILRLFNQRPECPVEPEIRKWVDARYQWLTDAFSPRSGAITVVLPTEAFFPDPYGARAEDAERMLVRVAGYMGVDPDRLELHIYEDDRPPHELRGDLSSPAGLYFHRRDPAERARIGISAKKLNDPMALVATLAHEIGHELLLGEERLSHNEQDHEPLTDLLTVFLGMGIFSANSTVSDRGWSANGWHGWKTSRLGYLDQRTFGYALARFARSRSESKPAWIKHVRADVRRPLKISLSFLNHVHGRP